MCKRKVVHVIWNAPEHEYEAFLNDREGTEMFKFIRHGHTEFRLIEVGAAL